MTATASGFAALIAAKSSSVKPPSGPTRTAHGPVTTSNKCGALPSARAAHTYNGRSVFTASVATMASNNGTSRRSLCSEAATAAVVKPGAGSAWMDARSVRCVLTCVVNRVDGVEATTRHSDAGPHRPQTRRAELDGLFDQ